MPVRPLSAEARKALTLHRWPGNVRELENTIHRAVLLSTGTEIGIDGILTPDGARLDQAALRSPPRMRRSPPSRSRASLVGRTVADVERDLILETLKHCLGNRTHAANILGISIRTLRNKLNEYAADGVPVPPPRRRRDPRRGVAAYRPQPNETGRPGACPGKVGTGFPKRTCAIAESESIPVILTGMLSSCRPLHFRLTRL